MKTRRERSRALCYEASGNIRYSKRSIIDCKCETSLNSLDGILSGWGDTPLNTAMGLRIRAVDQLSREVN